MRTNTLSTLGEGYLYHNHGWPIKACLGRVVLLMARSLNSLSLSSLSLGLDLYLCCKLVPSCCVIFDLEPLSLSFDIVFKSEIFKSFSLRSVSSLPSCDLVSWKILKLRVAELEHEHVISLSLAENVIVVGADNRPPMLDKTNYSSWASRMLLYIKGKEHGNLLVDLVLNRPFQYGTIVEPRNENTPATVRPCTYTDLTDEEKIYESVDIKATNIVIQGLPQDIYNLVNHNEL
ncbi:hypothetical protein Tco_0985546 [Tanacetum coccineum]